MFLQQRKGNGLINESIDKECDRASERERGEDEK